MRRKSPVRFGGGRLEKESQGHLVSRLPNELDPEDWAANDRAVYEGTRILSAYTLTDGTRFWVITEHDRSVTTCLTPDEY